MSPGDELADGAVAALGALGRGFAESADSPVEPGDDRLDGLREASVAALFRLLGLFFADDRGLVDPDAEAGAGDGRDAEPLDVGALRRDVLAAASGSDGTGSGGTESGPGDENGGLDDAYSDTATVLWERLTALCRRVDSGEATSGSPTYGGDLFGGDLFGGDLLRDDPVGDDRGGLADRGVSDRRLAEAVYRLSTAPAGDGEHTPVSFADLDTRRLGTAYERVLECEFRVAPEPYAAVSEGGDRVWKPASEVPECDAVDSVAEGGLYVAADADRRKAAGAYYTPEAVTADVVENAVGPLVEELRADLREAGYERGTAAFAERFLHGVTDLRILDPAVGCGRFLTGAADFLTEAVLTEARAAGRDSETAIDEPRVRRAIAAECLYGVDVDGTAVELATLAVWLETAAAGPTALVGENFDREGALVGENLRQGNALVGADVGTVESIRAELGRQGSRYDGRIRQSAPSDDRSQLSAAADVHTADAFDCDLPDDARERILAGRREESRDAASGTVSTPGENWVERARASADERDAFHWPLAFPDAFYDGNGSLRDDAGFDAVVGNPPYVNIERTPDDLAGYFRSEYDFARRRFDQYVLFAERALALTRPGGYHGFVVPDKLLSETYASALRRALLERHAVERIVDLRDGDVFADARTSPIAYTVRAHAGDGDRPNSDGDDSPNSDGSDADSVSGDSNRDAGGTGTVPVVALDGDPREVNRIPLDDFRDGDEYRIRLDWDERTAAVVERVEAGSVPASRLLYVSWGLQPGSADEFFRYGSRPDRPEARPLVKGGDVDRYAVEHGDGYVIYDPERLHRPAFPGLFETEKLLFREVAGDRGLVGSYDDDGYYTDHSVINCVPKTSLRGVDDAVLRERGVRFVEEPRADGDAGTADGRADAVGDGSEASDSGSGADDGESSGGAYDRDAVVYLDDLDRASSYSLKAVLGILNSSLVGFYYGRSVSGDLNVFPQHVRDLPLPDVRFGSERRRAETVAGIRSAVDRVPDGKSLHESDGVRERLAAAADDALHDALAAVVDDRLALERERRDVEPSLGEYVDADLDDVGAHGATRQLGALGSHESPEGVEESVIGATTETHEGLRIGTVTCERTAPGRVVVAATVRYKPDSEARRETDAYGYTETGPVPATVVTDLPEPAADAVEAFVPVLTERSGFTGLARKSITPLDRLEALELPQPAAVAEGVSAYLDARERADRLADEAERAERLVDEVVFELYDLSDAEVDTVRGSDAVD